MNPCFRGVQVLVLTLSELFGLGLKPPKADHIGDLGFLRSYRLHVKISHMIFYFFFSDYYSKD